MDREGRRVTERSQRPKQDSVDTGHLNFEVSFLIASLAVSLFLRPYGGLAATVKLSRQIPSGGEATDTDLTSLDTWMKVDEVEQRKTQGKPTGDDSRSMSFRPQSQRPIDCWIGPEK
jgi:hypothetical protein